MEKLKKYLHEFYIIYNNVNLDLEYIIFYIRD